MVLIVCIAKKVSLQTAYLLISLMTEKPMLKNNDNYRINFNIYN
jgi:hypothetical protein